MLLAEAGNRIRITPGESTRPENEPSEVLVLGQKNPVPGKGEFHYLFVHGAVPKLAHGEHVVTLRAQGSNRGEITALVREKAHSAGFTGS
jgi:hypothetical protein